MIAYVIRRLLLAVPILFGVTIINFFIIQLAPGSPADLYISPTSTPEMTALIRQQMGLDQPIIVQYFRWLRQVLVGNLGTSFGSGQAVTTLIGERILPTLTLMGASLVVAYLVALPLGILAARHRNKPTDYAVVGASFAGISIPNFFLGLALIYIFAIELRWVPPGGMYSLGIGGGLGDRLLHLVLPVIVLSSQIAGNMIRYVRASMVDALGRDYIRTARAKGLSSWVVVNRHALRNALIPIITIVGVDVATLIGGAVVTEQVFQWPGLGQLTIQAISQRDYAVLMGVNLLAATSIVLVNIVTDVAYGAVDPRISFS